MRIRKRKREREKEKRERDKEKKEREKGEGGREGGRKQARKEGRKVERNKREIFKRLRSHNLFHVFAPAGPDFLLLSPKLCRMLLLRFAVILHLPWYSLWQISVATQGANQGIISLLSFQA